MPKPTQKTTPTKKDTPLFAPHDDKFDLFNLAEVLQKIVDSVIGNIDLDSLTSNVESSVKNLTHLRTIGDALTAQVIAQHGTDDDRKKVVERLKKSFFS